MDSFKSLSKTQDMNSTNDFGEDKCYYEKKHDLRLEDISCKDIYTKYYSSMFQSLTISLSVLTSLIIFCRAVAFVGSPLKCWPWVVCNVSILSVSYNKMKAINKQSMVKFFREDEVYNMSMKCESKQIWIQYM